MATREAVPSVPPALAAKYRVVPLDSDSGGPLRVGAARPLSNAALSDLAFLTGREITEVRIGEKRVEAFLREHGLEGKEGAAASQSHAGGGGQKGAPLKRRPPSPAGSNASEVPLARGPITRQVDRIIRRAIRIGASDIHVEPYEESFRVRYRLDGVLQEAGALRPGQKSALISRLKVMASLDIAEKRRPQDSRIRVEHDDGRPVDLRVSTLPTAHGEKVVLRVLDKSAIDLDLGALGFEEGERERFERAVAKPYGMVLVTGPTGSGKTTTLYSALSALNTTEVNVTTIEDPIEYNLAGINQARVRSGIGFTFAKALRAFLRQDPDIIMVGEIRDTETAEVAVRAALTGHLVLSTLHTNDAPSTVTRLVDMGLESYLVASSVRLVVAQRLVRTVCSHCKEEAQADVGALEELGLSPDTSVMGGTGCSACDDTGYRGRTALFEIMPVGETLSEMIARGASTYELRRQTTEEGGRSLLDAGAQAVRAGRTTPQEVLREVIS